MFSDTATGAKCLYAYNDYFCLNSAHMNLSSGPNRAAAMAEKVSQSKSSHLREAEYHSDLSSSPRGARAASFQREHHFSMISKRPSIHERLVVVRMSRKLSEAVLSLLMTLIQQHPCERSVMIMSDGGDVWSRRITLVSAAATAMKALSELNHSVFGVVTNKIVKGKETLELDL